MHLAAMVRLMIEHMRDQDPARPRPLALGGSGIVSLVGAKPGVVDRAGPIEDFFVKTRTLGFQFFPVRKKRTRFRDADRRPRQIGEAAHPALIAPQDVV